MAYGGQGRAGSLPGLGWVKVTSQVYARKLSLVTNQLFTRAPTLPRPHMTRVSSRVTIYSARAVKSSEGIKIAVVWP